MTHLLSLLCVSWLGLVATEPSQAAAQKTLTRLRGLAGEWRGTFEWSGARTGAGKVKALYSLTGNGSAIVENLIMGDEIDPSMTSVYHLDGSELRMTHYCGAQNQPRLKASRIDEPDGVVSFSFVDGTDLAAHPAHVVALEIRFVSDDRLQLRFTFEGGGRTSVERIDLERVSHVSA